MLEVVGRLTRLTRTMITRGEAMLAMVAVLIWRYNALPCVDKKNIQPKMFKDIQTEDFQTKDIQRYSNHLEECL